MLSKIKNFKNRFSLLFVKKEERKYFLWKNNLKTRLLTSIFLTVWEISASFFFRFLFF